MYYAFTIDTSLRRIQRDKQSWFYAPWYWENCEEINLRSSPYKLATISSTTIYDDVANQFLPKIDPLFASKYEHLRLKLLLGKELLNASPTLSVLRLLAMTN